MYNPTYSYAEGWVCPVCKNVYAPFIPVCYKCNSQQKWYPRTYDEWYPVTYDGTAVPVPGVTTTPYITKDKVSITVSDGGQF